MSRIVNRVTGFAMLLVMTLATVTSTPGVVSAAAGNPSYCDADIARLTNSNIGKEVPVILVHGLSGKSQDWGSINSPNSFANKVNNIPGVAVAHQFEYDANNWIVNQSNRPLLAKTIDCVSRLSLNNGGKGKVIIVGYSMGGLLARDALSRRSTDGQRAIADQVGQVITIATPHTGVINALGPLTAAFAASLPPFPAQTIVHTTAADVTRVYYDAQARETRREQPHDDTLVSVDSALIGHTADAVKGGASKTITCNKQFLTYGSWVTIPVADASCEHGKLIQNASYNGVQSDTVDTIKKYVAWLSTPPPVPSAKLTIGALTTTYDARWTDVYYGPSGYKDTGSANDTTNTALCTDCEGTPKPTLPAFIDIFQIGYWCTTPMLECATSSSPILGAAPPVTIGGRTPDYSAKYTENGTSTGSFTWCFEEEKLCVSYRRSPAVPQVEISQALLDVFRTATWATN